MKKLILNKGVKGSRLNFPSSRKVLILILFSFVLLSSVQTLEAQPPAMPMVAVQFANPTYDCPTQIYCLDVQFMTDTPGKELFLMNMRFFYEDNILEFLSVGNFQGDYESVYVPIIDDTYDSSLGDYLGFPGSTMDFVEGVIQLNKNNNPPAPPIYLTGQWTTLFTVCFHVDDPGSWNINDFCPAVIWDLQENPPPDYGGYLDVDEGVVMTVVLNDGSEPTAETAISLNWQHDGTPDDPPVGFYDPTICIPTRCGTSVPVSNWALFLGIGLMLVLSAFIYRRRMS
jgi:hypothetical protein